MFIIPNLVEEYFREINRERERQQRYILDTAALENGLPVVLNEIDNISSFAELWKYVERYVRRNWQGRKFKMDLPDGSKQIISVSGALHGEVRSTVCSKTLGDLTQRKTMAKKLIIAMAHLDDILAKGEKVGWVPTGHPGNVAVYVKTTLPYGYGHRFTVILTVKRAPDSIGPYSINTPGTTTYQERHADYVKHLHLKYSGDAVLLDIES
jgi:hypothetical protein